MAAAMRVNVLVTGCQREALIRAPARLVSKSVEIEALPVREAAKIPAYPGPYEVTPGADPVVLGTDGLRMEGNVTVNPVPENYGLITWDGSILTVS